MLNTSTPESSGRMEQNIERSPELVAAAGMSVHSEMTDARSGLTTRCLHSDYADKPTFQVGIGHDQPILAVTAGSQRRGTE